MEIKSDIELAPYTSFKIGGKTKFFCVAENVEDVKQALEFAKEKKVPFLVLGGGSNMLVSDRGFEGLVMHLENKGIEVVQEGSEEALIKIAAGEVWDEVVAFAVMREWWGIENLSHIPGRSGAFAVQNVGAYGQEASQVVESVEVFDVAEGYIKEIKNSDCNFSYRSSIFNGSEKGNFVILNTFIKLKKGYWPNFSYRDLKERFKEGKASIQDIRSAIIEIRNKKFPFPVEAKNGNAGSFFKNIVMTGEQHELLKSNLSKSFESTVAETLESKIFKSDTGEIKVPTAFLLDICGLKNVNNGGAAINQNQPLVIINATGMATAKDVLGLIKIVKTEVFKKTGLRLILEPELIGFSAEELAEIDI